MSDFPRGLGAVFAFVIGGCVGSFVNVVAYRLPRELSISTPRSFCPQCNRAIPRWANIPILAYIGLRGRCLMCGGAIPFRYFLAELALAVAALYLYLNFPLADALARFVFCAALFVVALIDYDWRLIPNIVTFPGVPIGILAAWLAMPEVGLKSSIAGAIAGAGFLFLTGAGYAMLRGREGVGMGDVFLLGMTGAFIGLPGVIFTLFVGSILGAVGGLATAFMGETQATPAAELPPKVAEALNQGGGAKTIDGTHEDLAETSADSSILRTEVPFGPFLALAAAFYTLFQPQLAHWYFSR